MLIYLIYDLSTKYLCLFTLKSISSFEVVIVCRWIFFLAPNILIQVYTTNILIQVYTSDLIIKMGKADTPDNVELKYYTVISSSILIDLKSIHIITYWVYFQRFNVSSVPCKLFQQLCLYIVSKGDYGYFWFCK